MINHYRTLGVDPQAEAVVIRGAYLALIRRYHPDKGGAEADTHRAQAVTAAWDVLRDPERRAAYDEARRARFQPDGPGGAAGFGGAPRVRGGAAGRNLFLLLAAGTLGLGWWALGQPQAGPEAGAPVEIAASKPAPAPAEPMIRPSSDERAAAAAVEAEPLPRLADVRREPDVEVVLPPLPASEPVRMPVRTAESRVQPQASRRPVATAERVQPAALPARPGPSPVRPGAAPARPRAEERTAAVAAPAASAAPTGKSGRVDLAPLERHLQLLTDQSLRYGTEAKRSRLFATRETFIKRIRDCSSDTCKRDAYLRRNAEVGEIMRNEPSAR